VTATLRVFEAYELSVDGEEIKGGSRSAPVEITVDGKRKEWYGAVPATSSVTVFDGRTASSTDPISDFDFLFIEADQTVILELTVDKGGEVATKVSAVEVLANRPRMLLGNGAYTNFTTDVSSGTRDVIDFIRVRNSTSTASANVRVMLIT